MQNIVNELGLLKQRFQTIEYLKILQHACVTTSLLPWPAVIISTLCSICLFISWAIGSGDNSDLIVSLLLILLLILNIAVSCHNEIQKQKELSEKLEWLSDSVKEDGKHVATKYMIFLSEYSNVPDIQGDDDLIGPIPEFVNYVNNLDTTSILNGPSHSFSTVWKKVQGSLSDEPVSFPTALVSTGDVIGLCVGQAAPCNAIYVHDACTNISRGEVLTAEMLHVNDDADDTDDSNLLHKFEVTKNPLIDKLEDCLSKAVPYQSPSIFHCNKSMLVKRREKVTWLLLVLILPVFVLCSSLASLIWYLYIYRKSIFLVSTNQNTTSAPLFPEWRDTVYWYDSFVSSPFHIVLPLLPITCPMVWLILYAIGEAKTLHAGIAKRTSVHFKAENHPHTEPPLSGGTVQSQSFDHDQASDGDLSWIRLFPHVLLGNKRLLPRNAGTFDTLGALTVLCCVNKEGLLSWIDSSPEKVFFFNDGSANLSRDGDGSSRPDDVEIVTDDHDMKSSSQYHEPSLGRDVRAELLTLSQDTHNSTKLYFDDTDWAKHISSLKTIGLNILVTYPVKNADRRLLPVASSNNEEFLLASIAESLQKLYDAEKKQSRPQICQDVLREHRKKIACVAREQNVLGPGAAGSRTGLHSLARLTGFEDEVSFLYLPQRVVSVYRRTDARVSDLSRKSLVEAKYSETHISYGHGVVVTNVEAEQNYLLVSGSGDLVLDFCRYFWDGHTIRPLDSTMRNRMSDFYNRAGAVGQCVAFSFVPVSAEFSQKNNVIVSVDSADHSDGAMPAGQIFLGMVSLQHQNRLPVFRLVEALDAACIRFVHFTSEDEVRARVFAEKMGIEVGWNCHISLSANKSQRNEEEESKTTQEELVAQEDEDTDPSSKFLTHQPSSPSTLDGSSFSESAMHASNRANLPRGVENIIPHIENVDNVPLLVPLFTDCQHDSTRRMIEIMQQYGEVVCCIGSCDSLDNMSVFAQADVGIAIRPTLRSSRGIGSKAIERNFSFYSRNRFGSFGPLHNSSTIDSLNPNDVTNHGQGDNVVMETARILNTFPCSIALAGDDSLAVVYNMIKQARHFLFLVHISLIFHIKCLCMFALTMLLCHVVHLPRIFTSADIFWLCYIIAPTLSFSLLGSPRDPDVMSWATVKNSKKERINRHLVRRNISNFFIKFAPSCLAVLLGYAIGLASCCLQWNSHKLTAGNNTEVLEDNNTLFNTSVVNVRCYPYFIVEQPLEGTRDNTMLLDLQKETSFKQRVLQQLAVSATTLYTCIISAAYVHRWRLFTAVCPFTNRVWTITVSLLCILQAIYSTIVVVSHSRNRDGELYALSLGSYQIAVGVILLSWPLPCLAFNELAKWKEIRMWNRAQKRARLEFGTKLGMNSPF